MTTQKNPASESESGVSIDLESKKKTENKDAIEAFDQMFGDLRFRCVDGSGEHSEVIREAYIDLERVAKLECVKRQIETGGAELFSLELALNIGASRDGFNWRDFQGSAGSLESYVCFPWSSEKKRFMAKSKDSEVSLASVVRKAFPETNSRLPIRFLERIFKLTQNNHKDFDFNSQISETYVGFENSPTLAEQRKNAIDGLREIYKEAHGEMRARRSTEFEIVRSHIAACGFLTAMTNAWVAAAKPEHLALWFVGSTLFLIMALLWWRTHKRIAYDNNSYRYFSAVKSGIEKFWLGKTLGGMQSRRDMGPRGDGYRRTQTMLFDLTAGLVFLNIVFFILWALTTSDPSESNAGEVSMLIMAAPPQTNEDAVASFVETPPEPSKSTSVPATTLTPLGTSDTTAPRSDSASEMSD